MQLDLLWKFMQIDMEADKFEAEMRQAPTRLKLLKQRDFLLEQQGNMKKIEGEVTTMADRLDAIEDEAQRLSALLEKERAALEAQPPADQEGMKKAISSMQKLVDSLTRYEQELQKIRKDAEARDRQQKEIRVRAAKTKAEYDLLKKNYDVEFKADSSKLKALREKTEQASRSVDAKLLERYRSIKQHSSPPMALLVGDQCGGCYMSLPSVMLRDIQSGDEIVECDNCGRIIYVPSAT